MRTAAILVSLALVLVAAWMAVKTREPGSARAPGAADPGLGAPAAAELRAAELAGSEPPGAAREPVVARDPRVEAPRPGVAPPSPAPVEPAETVVVLVRLVDALGHPLPELDVVVAHELGIGSLTTLQQRTARDGRLRIALFAPEQYGDTEHVQIEHGTGRDRRGGRLAIPAILPPGEHDLGDLEMGVLPLLAAGVVQNPAGIAVPRATVVAIPTQVDADGARTWGQGASYRTEADGRFELRGWASHADVQVSASHRVAAKAPPIQVPRGTANVVITLQVGGILVGRVLVDPGLPLGWIRVGAVDERGVRVTLATDQTTGELRPRHVSPGRYALEVLVGGRTRPVFTLPDVEVTNLGTTAPPELNPLDLRGAFHPVAVRVVDALGAPVDATVYFRAAGEDDRAWTMRPHAPGAPAICWVPAASADVCAGLAGVGSAELFDVAGDVVLALGSAWEIDVRLATPVALKPGHTLGVRLAPLQRPELGAKAWFDADGACRACVSHAGPHRLEFFVRMEESDTVLPLASPEPDPVPSPEIEIRAPHAGRRQVVELEAPADLLRSLGSLRDW